MKKTVDEIVSSHYLPRLKRFEENHKVLDWENVNAQLARFGALSLSVPLEGLSLLDVGCGMGDLFSFLKEKKIGIKYTGIDLLPEMVDRAKKNLPQVDFRVGDALDGKLFAPQSFDVVYCCGVFNLEMGDNLNFLSRGLEVFYQTASRFVVVSLLNECSTCPEDKYHYYKRDEVKDLLIQKGRRFQIVEDYLPNDFTLVIEK